MLLLVIVSAIWAFSFGLIKTHLGEINSSLVTGMRLGLSLLVFLPFLRPGRLSRRLAGHLFVIGAVQYGLMYLTYIYSFRFLLAHQVALFTILTPIYVTAVNDLYAGRLHARSLAAAAAAVAGTAIVRYRAGSFHGFWTGFLLLQLSNLSFAFGQVRYRRVMAAAPRVRDRDVYAVLYLGAVTAAAVPALLTVRWEAVRPRPEQWLVLLYLGVVASGLGFFLWNVGARRVSAGTLAVMNNVKIPAAVAVSLLCFGESADLPRLLLGAAVIAAALGLNARGRKPAVPFSAGSAGAGRDS